MNRELLKDIIKIGAGAGLVLLSFAGLKQCTGPDSDNRYEVIARVDHVGDESFGMTDITIVEAHGEAEGRLSNGETVHDNYRDVFCIATETSNDFDEEVDDGQLSVGSIVKVWATVGKSKAGCVPGNSKTGYVQTRSMLEDLQVIEP